MPHLALIGRFELSLAGSPVPLCAASERLLALLALSGRGRPVRRASLADRLWDCADARSAGARLRSTLWRLPRVDGVPVVTGAAQTLALAESVTVDLFDAERQAAGLLGEHEPPADLSRFGDDLLPDWAEDWVVLERESYRQTRLRVLESASERLRMRGRYTEALAAAMAAVRCEPLRETAQRRAIEVHLAEGNQAEALRQYQTFRRLLARELGLPPSPAIRCLVAPLLGRPVDHVGGQRPGSAR